MKCIICQSDFIPSKYRPSQKVCSKKECQRLRQIQSSREWRIRNPDYFKGSPQDSYWHTKRRNYSKLWRQKNKAKLKKYANKMQENRRSYMREYMRKKRQLGKNVNVNNI